MKPAPKPAVLQTSPAPERPVLPIVAKSRGVAYNVQSSYAGWQKGVRKQGG